MAAGSSCPGAAETTPRSDDPTARRRIERGAANQKALADAHDQVAQCLCSVTLTAQTTRTPLIVQGDFHATAVGRMMRWAGLSLARPVDVITTGALGTGDLAFLSAIRSVESKLSQLVGMDATLKPTEKNGFTVIDITPDKMTFTVFMWRPPQPIEAIDTMKPALVYAVPRKT